MMMIGPYFYENLDRDQVDAIVDALSRDEKPPVPVAGYLKKDETEVKRGKDAAIPTSSQDIASHEVLTLQGKGAKE